MHRLLQRQIKRFFGDAAAMPPGLEMFMAAVSDAYESADADRLVIERSLELTSGNLNQQNSELRAELAERQRAEAQLEQLLSMLGTTLESTADGIMALDTGGRIVRFNRRFVDMWRIPDSITAFWEHDLMMSHVSGQLKDPAGFLSKMDDLRRRPEAESFDVVECADGRIIERYSLPQPVGVDSVGRIFSFRDITDRKLAEAAMQREKEEQHALIKKLEEAHNQLLQSEKMASIGQLAAGVAHEINNPIGFVNSNMASLQNYLRDIFAILDAYADLEPLLRQAPAAAQRIQALKQETDIAFLREDIVSLLRESREGLDRVKKIVQDLKDFSHVDQAEWQWVDLHGGLDSTLNIVHNEIKYKAEVVKQYGDLPQVECLASQLNQVFMNMLVNASHAMEGARGRITIRTGAVNDHVWVEFADTGKGIAPENLKRIFDPFFTTKPVGKGTGLGLSLAYGIVQKHHGRIEVESEPGKGATFRVWLPVNRVDANKPVDMAVA